MVSKIKGFLNQVILSLFYKIERVEYFSFRRNNEFLVIHYVTTWDFLEEHRAETERAIGSATGRVLREKLRSLDVARKNTQINEGLTINEFMDIATKHSVLKNDSWVKMRQDAIAAGIAR